MRRREFVTLVGAAWPRGVLAQQPLPVVGFVRSRRSRLSKTSLTPSGKA
jgi:hypothetical protein